MPIVPQSITFWTICSFQFGFQWHLPIECIEVVHMSGDQSLNDCSVASVSWSRNWCNWYTRWICVNTFLISYQLLFQVGALSLNRLLNCLISKVQCHSELKMESLLFHWFKYPQLLGLARTQPESVSRHPYLQPLGTLISSTGLTLIRMLMKTRKQTITSSSIFTLGKMCKVVEAMLFFQNI